MRCIVTLEMKSEGHRVKFWIKSSELGDLSVKAKEEKVSRVT